ncbi:MAG: 3-dehydroquinate synthase [Vicingaceae bacterium]|jgi:3-dehydroquinate synthase
MNLLQKNNIHVISELGSISKAIIQAEYSQVYVLMDENTNQHCLPLLQDALVDYEVYFFFLEVPAGEASKDLSTCASLWESLSEDNADRKTLLLNLGGGMITDLGAFVASLYKRGISFYNIPTSLLAMVDASIGGKCGIDFGGFKNQIGVFQNAEQTFIFPKFLETLPELEFWSGMAEICKHALISDSAHWEALKIFNRNEITPALIEHSAALKTAIVANDPLEKGERKKLNFGHTIGHAVESYFLQLEKPMPHGYAVAFGMICEAHISTQQNLLNLVEYDEIEDYLKTKYEFPTIPEKDFPILLEFMEQDKKNEQGQVNFTLLKAIGSAVINQSATESQILSSLSYLFNE